MHFQFCCFMHCFRVDWQTHGTFSDEGMLLFLLELAQKARDARGKANGRIAYLEQYRNISSNRAHHKSVSLIWKKSMQTLDWQLQRTDSFACMFHSCFLLLGGVYLTLLLYLLCVCFVCHLFWLRDSVILQWELATAEQKLKLSPRCNCTFKWVLL